MKESSRSVTKFLYHQFQIGLWSVCNVCNYLHNCYNYIIVCVCVYGGHGYANSSIIRLIVGGFNRVQV